jgi:hypothetical protein
VGESSFRLLGERVKKYNDSRLLVTASPVDSLPTHMETVVHIPETNKASSIIEVVAALKEYGLKGVHDKKDWGDWINLTGEKTVISIESERGMSRKATIEYAEGEDDHLEIPIISAFRELGWFGTDEDGEYRL